MRNNPLELNNDHDQMSLDSKDSKDKEVQSKEYKK
jgi:hypothetical protein